ncbi:UTRA domain-containing protein [Longispora sp. K20-0274]|uniref:GntR family transcriptional regulator n=1 Tax=Longispora sp. K20-0274 TaxID=3088255 RepID=UPI00399B8ABD
MPKIRRDARKRYAARSRGTGAADVEARELGAEPRTEYGEIGRTAASPEVASALRLAEGADTLVRRRVTFANDEPTQIADSYYPWNIVKDSLLAEPNVMTGGSLAQLAEMGHAVARFTEDVDVRLPTDAERRTLEIDSRQPVFQITHIAWTADDIPIEVAIHIMPGSLWTLHYGWDDGAP